MKTEINEEGRIERANDLSFASGQLKILPSITLKEKVLDSKKPILFIHPPKTAGTNVANLAKAITIAQETIEVRAVVPRQEGMSPNLFTKGKIGGLKTIIQDPSTFDCSTKDIKFISGHMPLPSLESEFSYFHTEGLNYVAIMRDPIERELSSANFDYQRKYVEESEIESYLLDRPLDNLQTRLLAGEKYMDGECDEQTLEIAKQNILSRFRFVAPTDDVEVVMALLSNHFNMDRIAYARAQVTGIKVVSKENLELCEALKAKHQYDYSLYQWVKKQWEIWKSEHIESIEEIRDNGQQYLVLDPYFSQTKQPQFLYLNQIESFESYAELVTLQQRLAISDNKQMNNLLSNQPEQTNEQEDHDAVAEVNNEQASSYFDAKSLGSFLQQVIRYEPNIRYFLKIANIELPKFDISNEFRAIADFGATFLKYNSLKMIPYQILESASYFANLKVYEILNNNHKGVAPYDFSTLIEKCGPYIVTGGTLGLPNQTPITSAINGAAVCIQNYHMNYEESLLAKTARLGMDLGLSIYLIQQNIPILQVVTGVVALDISFKFALVTGELLYNDFVGAQFIPEEQL